MSFRVWHSFRSHRCCHGRLLSLCFGHRRLWPIHVLLLTFLFPCFFISAVVHLAHEVADDLEDWAAFCPEQQVDLGNWMCVTLGTFNVQNNSVLPWVEHFKIVLKFHFFVLLIFLALVNSFTLTKSLVCYWSWMLGQGYGVVQNLALL